MVDKKPTSPSYPPIVDVLIVGAGPCGLATAARLREETPSAIFTDDEHQRYHWINKPSGRMPLIQAHNRRVKGVRAEKWRTYNSRRAGAHRRSYSSASLSSIESEAPSLSSSVDSAPDTEETIVGEGSLSTVVLDGTGQRWMERWNRAFETLEIDQLRSPMFFHVDPGDRDGLLAYTGETGRERDLWEITGCVGKEMSKHKRKKKMMRSKAQYVFSFPLPPF